MIRDALINDIKLNCDISDAKYWGYFSLCGLLMRYRDLFRSEKNLFPWSQIDQQEISDWITQKENLWLELESKDFNDLHINGNRFHPFEVAEINSALKDTGLVYAAGYGMYMKPAFLLAELQSIAEIYDYKIYVSGKEYARDIFSSCGMLQGRCIFIRLEPLRALLWEKFSEFKSQKKPSLEYAFMQYGFNREQEPGSDFEKKFEDIVTGYADMVLCHELAEAMEDSPGWLDILSISGDRNTEFLLRALKDLISDTSDFGPLKKIIDGKDKGALGLYAGLLGGHRQIMFPEIREAFREFLINENWQLMEEIRTAGYKRFLSSRQKILAVYKAGIEKESFKQKIKEELLSQSV